MQLPDAVRRKVYYLEVEKLLVRIDPATTKEIVFSKVFPTDRKFRADFFCPNLKVIIEINGGQHVNGRHNRGGKGYEDDLLKLNIASINGFRVFQFTYQMLYRGEHLPFFERLRYQTCRPTESLRIPKSTTI